MACERVESWASDGREALSPEEEVTSFAAAVAEAITGGSSCGAEHTAAVPDCLARAAAAAAADAAAAAAAAAATAEVGKGRELGRLPVLRGSVDSCPAELDAAAAASNRSRMRASSDRIS